MAKVDENMFRIYLDTVKRLSDLEKYDVYDTLDAFQKRLENIMKTSTPAQRYREMVKDTIRDDPRKQSRLFTQYDIST